MKHLRIRIEAEHEESHPAPIDNALDEFVRKIAHIGFPGAIAVQEFDTTGYPDPDAVHPSDHTVEELEALVGDKSPDALYVMAAEEALGKNRRTAIAAIRDAYHEYGE